MCETRVSRLLVARFAKFAWDAVVFSETLLVLRWWELVETTERLVLTWLARWAWSNLGGYAG